MRIETAGHFALPLALTLLLLAPASAASAENPREREPAGWDVRLAAQGEPGEPFEMSGTVLDAKGAPLAGAKLFVYHADAAGQYARGSGQTLRLAATLRTDERGRYRIRSVFPGMYGGVPAHVHYEFLEPALGASEVQLKRKGGEGPAGAVPVARDRDGVWRLTRQLTPHGARGGSSGGPPADDARSRAALDSARWNTSASAPRDSLR